MRFGSVEAGGTKFVCGIGNEHGEVLERIEFPTTQPEETLAKVEAFFAGKEIDAIGIGSFGPIDLNPASPTYGYVTTTPKPGWAQCDVLGKLKRSIHVPIGWDNDVNAAALGEATWGAAQGLGSCVYITVGTGIGGGVYVEGKLVHGLVHPEMGHIPVKRHPEDTFAGVCPYHGDCLEGMAAGPSLEKRWGVKGHELADNAKVWEIEAYYLAQAAVHAILYLSPERIVFGGGVSKQRQLFPLVYEQVQKLLNGYVQSEWVSERIAEYIVPPGLGDNAGLCGGLALAQRALEQSRSQSELQSQSQAQV
ncbi:ROK family protein [Paenibacillus koleovorans]|uniref:ROK family protein n=1 Tax=Paenibacillus koleovorans TaxID=121608 RepID=UPI000FDC38FD|nr:ROK family protein [Paenibacillus koleovorans]